MLRAGRFPAVFENHWLNRNGSLRRIAWSATAAPRSAGPGRLHHRHRHRRHHPARRRSHPPRERSALPPARRRLTRHGLHPRPQGQHALHQRLRSRKASATPSKTWSATRLAEFIPEDRRRALPIYLRKIAETGEAQGLLHLSPRRRRSARHRLSQQAHRRPQSRALRPRLRRRHHRADSRRRPSPHPHSPIRLHPRVRRRRHLRHRPRRQVTFVNPAAAQMLGYKTAEILGRNCPRPHPALSRRRLRLPSRRLPDPQQPLPPRHRPRRQRGLLAQRRHQLPRRIRSPPPGRIDDSRLRPPKAKPSVSSSPSPTPPSAAPSTA